MGLYDETLNNIKTNKEIRESGKLISIPWIGLPRLSKILPGVMKEHYAIVSAQQKVGKTQLCDFLYVYQVVDYLFNNRDKGLTAKILYFSLELSIEAKMRQAMCYRLFTQYGITISPQKLRSIFADYTLDEKIIELIEYELEWFEFFESIITYIDHIRNPYGIFNTVKTYCEKNGKYTYKNIEWQNESTGEIELRKVKDTYIPNNPNEIVIVITDHVSLLTPEAIDNNNLQNTINRYSSEYCLKMRDTWKCCVVNVQQQMPTGETQQFNYKGDSIIEKLKPTADGLGDSKKTARDCNLMIGIFTPYRYNFESYLGYNLLRLQDNFRELSIILNRDGISNANLPLFFNGSSNYFSELPKPNEMMESDYMAIEQFRQKII